MNDASDIVVVEDRLDPGLRERVRDVTARLIGEGGEVGPDAARLPVARSLGFLFPCAADPDDRERDASAHRAALPVLILMMPESARQIEYVCG